MLCALCRRLQCVCALLLRCYAKLRLKVNETKSAVASVTGRKFLGYSFWFAKGEVKRKVAAKPLVTFKQRVRQLTWRSGGRPYPCSAAGGCEFTTLVAQQ